MKKLLALAALAALGVAGSAQAAQVVFSTSNALTASGLANPNPTINPEISASPGDVITLYVYAKRSGSASGGYVNSLGLNIAQSGTSTVSATTFTVNNPSQTTQDDDGNDVTQTRWSGTDNGTLNNGGLLVSDSKAVAVGTSSSGFFQPLTSNANYRLHGTFTFVAGAPGTVNLFFQTGSGKISESAGDSGTSNFGFGDNAVSNAVAGSTSVTPDAIITITGNVPEPASLGLLGTAALGLVARRRKA